MNPKQIKQRKRKGVFRKWHRRMGFAASLFLLNLAITGILLNHYESLELHSRFVTSDWLLDHYGVRAPAQARCIADGRSQLCQLGRFGYLDGDYAGELDGELVALQSQNGDLAVVTNRGLWLRSMAGQTIDQIRFEDELGREVSNVRARPNAIQLTAGRQVMMLELDSFEWQILTGETARPWAKQAVFMANSESLQSLQQDYRQRQITQLRFVQDLHSGAIINLPGKLINDIAALLLIILAITGFITWQRRRSN